MPDRPTDSLEDRIAALESELAFPATPDLASRVGDRVRSGETGVARRTRRQPLPWRRVLAVALVTLVAGTATAYAALPELREAVKDLFGVQGIDVERVPELPTTVPGARPEVGHPSSLAAARRSAGFDLLRIRQADLFAPDQVYLRELAEGAVVSFHYRPQPGLPRSPHTGSGLVFTQFRARVDQTLVKKLLAGTGVDPVRVGGEEGYWLTGPEHIVAFRGEAGGLRGLRRLAGSTLLWQRGPIGLRLEAQIPKQRALRIARSVR